MTSKNEDNSGEEALTTTSERMFQSRTVRGKKNKGDNHMMTVGRGKHREFSTRVGTGCSLMSKGIGVATKP